MFVIVDLQRILLNVNVCSLRLATTFHMSGSIASVVITMKLES